MMLYPLASARSVFQQAPITLTSICALLLCAVVLFCAKPGAAVEPDASTLRYEEILAHAMTRSTAVRQIDAAFAASLADALEVELLPNPELEGEVGVPFSYPRERGVNPVTVGISQPLRLSYFGLREAVGTLLQSSAEEEKQAALIEFNQDVRLNYVRAWTLQQRQAIFAAAKKRALSLASELNRAVSAGAMTQGEAKLFAAEVHRLEAELAGLEAERARVRADLLRLSGIDLSARKLEEPPHFERHRVEDLLEAAEGSGLPVQKRALLKQRLARSYFELAERDAFPRFSPRLFYERSEDDVNYVGLGFSMELPFIDRNQPETQRRQGELSAASAEAEYLNSAAFRAQLKLFCDSYQATISQARIYREQVIPALEKARVSFERQFKAGQDMVLQIWQTEKEIVEAQLRLTELSVRSHEQLAELSVVLGEVI